LFSLLLFASFLPTIFHGGGVALNINEAPCSFDFFGAPFPSTATRQPCLSGETVGGLLDAQLQ